MIDGLAEALRDRLIPKIEVELLRELQTFVYRTTNPSPRAQDGCNDDRVMALAIAVELYRQRGAHPKREERRAIRTPKRAYTPPYPWMSS